MNKKHLFYTGIILFPFFWSQKTVAQQGEHSQRQVTVNQTIVDGKLVSSDTLIFEMDTVRQRAVQSKEISMELPYTKGSALHIENTYRKLNIRQSKDNKVRLTTTAFYYKEPPFTNEQWFEKLNIAVKNTDTGIVITSGRVNRSKGSNVWSSAYQRSSGDTIRAVNPINGKEWIVIQNGAFKEVKHNGTTVMQNGAYRRTTLDSSSTSKGTTVTQNGAYRSYTSGVPDAPTPPAPPVATSPAGVQKKRIASGTNIYSRATTNGTFTTGNWISSGDVVPVFDETGNSFFNNTALKTDLTIYLPAGVKINVTSRYADVLVDHDVSSIKANISNASLDMLNATDAVIHSNYSTVSAGNLTNATISAASGKVFVKDVTRLQLHTRYTKVEAGNCGWLKTESISDDYDIDEVKNFEGQKTYGSLRVNKLTGSFDLKGSSADLKIRNIEPSVSAITIDNKYADVRLPVASLTNYEVNFSGSYSSVFAPFERKEDTTQRSISQGVGTETFSYTTTNGTVVSTTKPVKVLQGGNGTVQKMENNSTRYTTTDGSVVSVTKPAAIPRSRAGNFIASMGDTKGIHTIFKLVCNSCNIDFK